jgi:E3 ubiquitin-protein ligase RNF213
LFDNQEVAIVGISNWTLDSAKMNRAVHLNRPLPSVDDLHFTVAKLLSAQNNHHLLKHLLSNLSKAYNSLYHSQKTKQDFYSLRDFYAFVKDLALDLAYQRSKNEFELLKHAVSHNFNGIGVAEFADVFQLFLKVSSIVFVGKYK